jgi:hypothetical protein
MVMLCQRPWHFKIQVLAHPQGTAEERITLQKGAAAVQELIDVVEI